MGYRIYQNGKRASNFDEEKRRRRKKGTINKAKNIFRKIKKRKRNIKNN